MRECGKLQSRPAFDLQDGCSVARLLSMLATDPGPVGSELGTVDHLAARDNQDGCCNSKEAADHSGDDCQPWPEAPKDDEVLGVNWMVRVASVILNAPTH